MGSLNLILLVGMCFFLTMHAVDGKVLSTSDSKNGPATITLGILSKRHEPVIFSHEMHIEAVERCATCHHTPPGETLACSDCHTTPFDPESTSELGLKGAYHHQCLGCHRDSESCPVGCTDCHAKTVFLNDCAQIYRRQEQTGARTPWEDDL